jgi:glycine C-acetyltransferase
LRAKNFNLGHTESPVTPVFFKGGVPEGTQVTKDLRENHNVFCSIVTYPVIPKDVLMLRLIPTAVHTLEDVEYTINAFSEMKKNLDSGIYSDGTVANMFVK